MNISLLLKKSLLLCSCLAAFTGSMSDASAEPVNCGSDPIHLAFFEYGLRYYVKDGQPQGMDKDFVDELAARSGCRFITEVMTKSRIYADLENGSLDMSTSGVKTPDREKSIWFIPMLKTKFLSIVNQSRQENAQTAAGFLNAGNLVLGVIRGAQYGPAQQNFIDQLKTKNRVDESKDITTSVNKFNLGQIDALLSTPSIYRMYFSETEADAGPVIYDWFPEDDGIIAGLMLSKARFSEQAVSEWRLLISEMHQDGTLERINAKYISKSEARQMVDFAD